MSEAVISVQNLSKRYTLGKASRTYVDYVTFREVMVREARALARRGRNLLTGRGTPEREPNREFWALKDVSFEVKRGEVTGIIGRNGAGKSTLLKVLSRITEPTKGRVELHGRVGSLLEVGTGFHPELTGRENIFLNGAILGMTQREVRRKLDEIVAFAEVEDFLDTPVKRYSSGMYVRLAFSVAAHLEPEILIVDEVLAVGDAQFQKRCLGKMDEISRGHGRTVLFVSHNMGALASLCTNAIWLEKGALRQIGPSKTVVNEYLAHSGASEDRLIDLSVAARSPSLHDDRLRIEALEWLSPLPLQHGEPASLRLRFRTRKPCSLISLGVGFSTLEGTRLLTYDTDYGLPVRPEIAAPGQYSVTLEIPALPLGPDYYTIDIGARSSDFHGLDYLAACTNIEVVPGPSTPAMLVRKGMAVRLESKAKWTVPVPERATG
jgi:lipopolysaccharide transport system ATP-binding protein